MGDTVRSPHIDTDIVPAEALQKAEAYVEQEEGTLNRLRGALGAFVTVMAVAMSLFHLYAAYGIMPTHVLRGIHVAFVLFLCFLLYPLAQRFRHRVRWWDWLAALAALVVVGYMLSGGDDFLERAIAPTAVDKALGIALILLVLEAARRTAGWIMPAICIAFVVYAMVGHWLPPPWTHYGMDVSRIVGHMYMTLEGIFGIPIDVSSCSRSTARCCSSPAPASSSSTSRSPRWAASRPARAAPSCSPRSCSAAPRAAAWRRP
jgi:TRAP-type uncharacterized transport system fused permease subunit